MGKKKKSRRSDYISYIFFRLFLSVLRTLPRKLSRSFCTGMGNLVYKLDKRHRNMTIENLRLSFPEKSEEEILDISRKVFENLGATLYDYAILPKINECNYKDYFEYEGTRYVEKAFLEKKGILFLASHLCCWEMMSVQCFVNGKTSVLAKDLHNEYVNRYIKEVRAEKEVLVLPVRHSVGQVMKILKNGGTVHTLLDQYTHKHEAISVDFFGRPAWTAYFAALLALKIDMCVIPTFIKRIGDFRYKLYYLKPVEITVSGDRKKDIEDITQALTKVIEDEIRKRPEDWFWMHNRWKD